MWNNELILEMPLFGLKKFLGGAFLPRAFYRFNITP